MESSPNCVPSTSWLGCTDQYLHAYLLSSTFQKSNLKEFQCAMAACHLAFMLSLERGSLIHSVGRILFRRRLSLTPHHNYIIEGHRWQINFDQPRPQKQILNANLIDKKTERERRKKIKSSGRSKQDLG